MAVALTAMGKVARSLNRKPGDKMTSEQIDALAAALAKAQGEMQNAKINRINPHFKNRYADLASVRDAIHGTLAKHELAIAQTTHVSEGAFVLRTTLMHKTGQWIASDYPLPIGAKPQELGSALTYARRYSLSSIVGIAADDDDDAEIGNVTSNGTKPATLPTLPKKDAREVYTRLQSEIREAGSSEQLKTWGAAAKARINVLPEDWQETLRSHFEEQMIYLKQREAA